MKRYHKVDFKSPSGDYSPGRDSSMQVIKSNIRSGCTLKGQTIEHKMACYYFIYFLIVKGFNIRYTADSELLDFLAKEMIGIEKFEV